MTEPRYTVVESVGSSIENVDKYSDLAKHHPSSGQEPNRTYQEIDSQLEEVRSTPDGRTLIKKDFVLLVNGSNQNVRVPSPVAGYVKTSSSYGTVRIFDGPGGKLLGQVLHLKPPFLVSTGDIVAYGQHIGLQDGTGPNGTRTYAIHVHAELEQAQFERYIEDLTSGTLMPGGSNPAPTPVEVRPLSWSHPFRDKENPILQLTKLSRAVAGCYPMGRNGLWHGGVHFDAGTAGVLDQSSVHCLADGEVVAYRIDSKYPTSTYRAVPLKPQEAPYATGFVLVRHRLQAPSVEGLSEAPPSLTFYSLYMHLQDWATYQSDPQQPRPAFWQQRYRVKADAQDPIRKGLNVRSAPNAKSSIVTVLEPGTEVRITNSGNFRQLVAILSGPQRGTLPMGNLGGGGYVWFKSLDSTAINDVYKVKSTVADPMDLGLNVRKAANKKSEILAVLPRGAEIEIVGAQGYCKLKAIHEGAAEPALLAEEEGQLPGYVWFGELEAAAIPGRYRVKSTVDDPMRTGANILAEGKDSGALLSVLAKGSEVRISGTGKYRKLMALVSGSAEPPLTVGDDGQLSGYINEAQLETFGATEPAAQDQVVFLEQPVPIKAGELIGHLGQYQDYGEASPQKKLHLEVFSADKVRDFIQQSRAWAARLPASGKTWLKLAKGTRVITHQEGFNKQHPPTLAAAGTESAADLLVPKSLLDGLRPEHRINLAATSTEKACNWYRLEGLLHDANRTLLDGWVREEVGVTPWHSPWEWEGYDFIVNTETPERNCAALMCAQGEVEEGDSDTLLKADLADRGPVRNRLFDLIDPAREEPLTAKAVQAAMALPSLAQALAQLIIHYESEWYWRPGKWDVLDKLYGDTSSTPNENWRAEKQRIQKLSWWSEVADKLGLPMRGAVWHMHPVGIIESFSKDQELITLEMLNVANPQGSQSYHQEILPYLNKYAAIYEVNSALRIAHFLAQIGHESGFKVKSENGNYSPKRMREIYGCKGGKNNYNQEQDDCNLGRLRNKLWTDENTYAHNSVNLLSYVYANRMQNGDEASQEGYKYRGRGVIQLTGRYNYAEYTRLHNAANPDDIKDFVENPDLIVNSLKYGIESAFVFCSLNEFNLAADQDDIERTTRIVNGGINGLQERKDILKKIKTFLEA